MNCTEAYKEHIEYTFNAFCRAVIHYAAINAWRDRDKRRQREILPKPCPLCRRKRGKSFTFIFSGVTHSRKSGNFTDAAGVRHGITYTVTYKCCMKKWRCFSMRNPKLVPYETIVRATSGEPEAIDECSCTVKKQATENKR